MAIPCHPPPNAPAGSTMDPYQTLNLNHNASASQIKTSYRKLALIYHPDRQCRSPSPTYDECRRGGGSSVTTSSTVSSSASSAKEMTDRFAAIAAAYATLSDPVKKKEYDHLYKLGAFDNEADNNQSGSCSSGHHTGGAKSPPVVNNYRYTENLSGGYYKPGYKPPEKSIPSFQQQQAAAAAAAFQQFQSMQSQDSFFDDLIYSPKSSQQRPGSPFATSTSPNTTNNNKDEKNNNSSSNGSSMPQRKRQPGIGFSFAPLGKHLSIHVPSRHEIVSNVTQQKMGEAMGNPSKGRGPGGHLFGTRVTFSQNSTTGSQLGKLAACATGDAVCGGGGGDVDDNGNSPLRKEKKVVSTTTRIAKGQRRIVRRTAHLRADGTKEVVIEENGIVRRRYVEENPNATGENAPQYRNDNDDTEPNRGGSSAPGGSGSGDDDDGGGGLQKEDNSGRLFGLLGIFKSCIAPCAAVG